MTRLPVSKYHHEVASSLSQRMNQSAEVFCQ